MQIKMFPGGKHGGTGGLDFEIFSFCLEAVVNLNFGIRRAMQKSKSKLQ